MPNCKYISQLSYDPVTIVTKQNRMDPATEKVRISYESASLYPENLIQPKAFSHTLEAYRKRLEELGEHLFGDETSLDVIESRDGSQGSCNPAAGTHQPYLSNPG